MADTDADAGDDRAVTPVVGKVLEVGLLVLYVALVSGVLFGGVVPDYRSAAGDEVADRTLAAAADAVETATVDPGSPTVDVTGQRRSRLELPATIAGRQYVIRSESTGSGSTRALVLDHPTPSVEDSARLSLPADVERVSGEWRSGDSLVVVATFAPDGTVEVRLQ